MVFGIGVVEVGLDLRALCLQMIQRRERRLFRGRRAGRL
jgi:hypothetical protein